MIVELWGLVLNIQYFISIELSMGRIVPLLPHSPTSIPTLFRNVPAVTGVNPGLTLQDPANAKVVPYFDSSVTSPSLAMRMVNTFLAVSVYQSPFLHTIYELI